MQLYGGPETLEGHLDGVEHLRHHHGGVANNENGDDDDGDACERVSHVTERRAGINWVAMEKKEGGVLSFGPVERRNDFDVEKDEEGDWNNVAEKKEENNAVDDGVGVVAHQLGFRNARLRLLKTHPSVLAEARYGEEGDDKKN